ncbi:MAG: hypothetical protein QGM50_11620 [Anaerolineae bacterium]|nr:hypothetical protein [Anaerolineae bacterium]
MQRTAGIRPAKMALYYAQADSVWEGQPSPTPPPLTQPLGHYFFTYLGSWTSNKNPVLKFRTQNMLYFHCTQKLLKALGLPIQAPPKISGSSPLAIWYANIIIFNDVTFLLFVNDPTLYTVVLHLSVIENSDQVFNAFRENITTSLASNGTNKRIIQHLLDAHHQGLFVKTTSRSMIGSMNDLINIFLFHIERDVDNNNPIDLHKIQHALNRMPQRKINWEFSVDAMHESLLHLKVA